MGSAKVSYPNRHSKSAKTGLEVTCQAKKVSRAFRYPIPIHPLLNRRSLKPLQCPYQLRIRSTGTPAMHSRCLNVNLKVKCPLLVQLPLVDDFRTAVIDWAA